MPSRDEEQCIKDSGGADSLDLALGMDPEILEWIKSRPEGAGAYLEGLVRIHRDSHDPPQPYGSNGDFPANVSEWIRSYPEGVGPFLEGLLREHIHRSHVPEPLRAFGAAVERVPDSPGEMEVCLRFLDYWDWWAEPDTRLLPHQPALRHCVEAFTHDVLNMSVYLHEILGWQEHLLRGGTRGPEVVTVSTLTEGYLLSARTACDAVAGMLGRVAAVKPGQAPTDSLNGLFTWFEKHPARAHAEASALLSRNHDWFDALKQIRDDIVHSGGDCNIMASGSLFKLRFYCGARKRQSIEPLLPLLANIWQDITEFSDLAAEVIHTRLALPSDLVGCKVLHGIRIPSVKKLLEMAPSVEAAWDLIKLGAWG